MKVCIKNQSKIIFKFRPFKCEMCSKQFLRSSLLANHMKHHNNVQKQIDQLLIKEEIDDNLIIYNDTGKSCNNYNFTFKLSNDPNGDKKQLIIARENVDELATITEQSNFQDKTPNNVDSNRDLLQRNELNVPGLSTDSKLLKDTKTSLDSNSHFENLNKFIKKSHFYKELISPKSNLSNLTPTSFINKINDSSPVVNQNISATKPKDAPNQISKISNIIDQLNIINNYNNLNKAFVSTPMTNSNNKSNLNFNNIINDRTPGNLTPGALFNNEDASVLLNLYNRNLTNLDSGNFTAFNSLLEEYVMNNIKSNPTIPMDKFYSPISNMSNINDFSTNCNLPSNNTFNYQNFKMNNYNMQLLNYLQVNNMAGSPNLSLMQSNMGCYSPLINANLLSNSRMNNINYNNQTFQNNNLNVRNYTFSDYLNLFQNKKNEQ